MKIENIKGFNDYTGEDASKRAEIKKILVDVFERYSFVPAETPVIEYEEFVMGENPNDEAVSDIFKLKDKGNRKLALRYELTFQLKRLVKNKKLPYKRYQIGEVFRDEPISSNRFRQFVQCDVDIIGSDVKDEAEILALTKEALDRLNIGFAIYINNRKLLNEILEECGVKTKEQVIKEIDKLDKLPENQIKNNLKKYKAEKILNIFKKPESYFSKYKAYNEIKELKRYCKEYGVVVNFSSSLARGLAYYTGSVFEIKTKEIKETICAGGSYSTNGVNSTGVSFGLDRIANLAKIKTPREKMLVISLNQDKEAINLAQKLRKQGKTIQIFYGKPSKALDYANSYNLSKVVFIGSEEIKKRKYKIKDMKTGKESFEKI